MSSSPTLIDQVVPPTLTVDGHGLPEQVVELPQGHAYRTEHLLTTVHSLASGLKIEYPLAPREAVAAAYAQYAKNDPIAFTHHKEFIQKYGHLVKETERVVVIGDFVALKDDIPQKS